MADCLLSPVLHNLLWITKRMLTWPKESWRVQFKKSKEKNNHIVVYTKLNKLIKFSLKFIFDVKIKFSALDEQCEIDLSILFLDTSDNFETELLQLYTTLCVLHAKID